MTKIALDVDVYVQLPGESFEQGCQSFVASMPAGLTATLKQEHGSSGGNPVFTLVGTREDVRAWLLATYTQGDEEDADYLLEDAVAEPAE